MGLGSHIEYPDRLNWLDRSCNTPIQSPRNEELSLETLKKQLRELQLENNQLKYPSGHGQSPAKASAIAASRLNRGKQRELEFEINTLTNKLHELKVDLKDIAEEVKHANDNKNGLVKAMFDDILSKSHSYQKRKSLRINEIRHLLS